MDFTGKYQILATTEDEVLECFAFLKENGIAWNSGEDLLTNRLERFMHLPHKYIHIGYARANVVTHSGSRIRNKWDFDVTVAEFLAKYAGANVDVDVSEFL